jgi:UPF0755 protein
MRDLPELLRRYLTPHVLTAVALLVILGMTAAAIWQIVESPNAIPDVGPPTHPAAPGEPVEVTVEAGQSPKDIGETLEEMAIIDSALQFRVLVALLGYDKMLQAGDYEFERGTPVLDTVYRIRRGEITTRAVTIIAGWRLEQVASALGEQGGPAEEFLSAARAGDYEFDFLAGLDAETSLEGYLYPATYSLRRSDSAQDLATQMLLTFDQNVVQQLEPQIAVADLSLHQIVTLASIIEREAVLPEEKPVMAQVFLKRLRLGIRLEADPTVQYAIAADPASVQEFGYWKAELAPEDLDIDSPYNTYRAFGLPPGPIANPTVETIAAVINPAETNYLYFVAKLDGTGAHAFAETFGEHLENVEKYLNQ